MCFWIGTPLPFHPVCQTAALFAARLSMKAGKPRPLLSCSWVLCSNHVEALPQSQRVWAHFRGHCSPKAEVHSAETLPLSWGYCWWCHRTSGGWDLCPSLFPSTLSPLLLSSKERYAGASCLAWPPASASKGRRPLTGLLFFSTCPGMSHKASITRI